MTGTWFVSYFVLWLLVVVLLLITIGLLQQLGLIQYHLKQRESIKPVTEGNIFHPALENDGPALGSPLPQFTSVSINGFGAVNLPFISAEGWSLLVFLSPLCEACQQIVDPLNLLVQSAKNAGQVVAIIRADEQACKSFISLFPLQLPVICDSERTITMDLNVHHAPFGLLYNAQGILMRKGGIKNRKDLLTFLGDRSLLHPV